MRVNYESSCYKISLRYFVGASVHTLMYQEILFTFLGGGHSVDLSLGTSLLGGCYTSLNAMRLCVV